MRAAVTLAGGEIVGAMQSSASWSSRIPGAIGMAVTLGTSKSSIRIKVDHNKAPHARPLELGNSTTFSESVINANGGFTVGRDGKRRAANRNVYAAMRKTGVGVGRELRHKVWGRGWSSMALRPFFFSTVEARDMAISQKFDNAINQIAKDAGFKE